MDNFLKKNEFKPVSLNSIVDCCLICKQLAFAGLSPTGFQPVCKSNDCDKRLYFIDGILNICKRFEKIEGKEELIGRRESIDSIRFIMDE